MTEKLATKRAMEAKAARSRIKSVICLSLLVMFQLCSHFVSVSTAFLGWLVANVVRLATVPLTTQADWP